LIGDYFVQHEFEDATTFNCFCLNATKETWKKYENNAPRAPRLYRTFCHFATPNSPAKWAKEPFKPSADSGSLVDIIKKN